MEGKEEVAELTPAECRDLLERDVVGRVAFMTPRGPRIVPVNYAVHDDALEIRTTAYSELGTYGAGERVAFEIDHLDREHHRGWSVVVLGACERVLEETAAVFDQPADGPEPWIGGRRTMLLRLPLQEMSGRRVGGVHWPHPVAPRT